MNLSFESFRSLHWVTRQTAPGAICRVRRVWFNTCRQFGVLFFEDIHPMFLFFRATSHGRRANHRERTADNQLRYSKLPTLAGKLKLSTIRCGPPAGFGPAFSGFEPGALSN